MSYDFYTSSSYSVDTDGAGALWQSPASAGLWYGSPAGWEYRPYYPTPQVVRRKPKKDPWDKYAESMKTVKEIKEITEVTKRIEVRTVVICGWCGARIARSKEEDPCEYCGS